MPEADPPVLVTGATGLLGSHIVEQLVGQGRRVRALVRAPGATEFLHSLDVELLRTQEADGEATLVARRISPRTRT